MSGYIPDRVLLRLGGQQVQGNFKAANITNIFDERLVKGQWVLALHRRTHHCKPPGEEGHRPQPRCYFQGHFAFCVCVVQIVVNGVVRRRWCGALFSILSPDGCQSHPYNQFEGNHFFYKALKGRPYELPVFIPQEQPGYHDGDTPGLFPEDWDRLERRAEERHELMKKAQEALQEDNKRKEAERKKPQYISAGNIEPESLYAERLRKEEEEREAQEAALLHEAELAETKLQHAMRDLSITDGEEIIMKPWKKYEDDKKRAESDQKALSQALSKVQISKKQPALQSAKVNGKTKASGATKMGTTTENTMKGKHEKPVNMPNTKRKQGLLQHTVKREAFKTVPGGNLPRLEEESATNDLTISSRNSARSINRKAGTTEEGTKNKKDQKKENRDKKGKRKM